MKKPLNTKSLSIRLYMFQQELSPFTFLYSTLQIKVFYFCPKNTSKLFGQDFKILAIVIFLASLFLCAERDKTLNAFILFALQGHSNSATIPPGWSKSLKYN